MNIKTSKSRNTFYNTANLVTVLMPLTPAHQKHICNYHPAQNLLPIYPYQTRESYKVIIEVRTLSLDH